MARGGAKLGTSVLDLDIDDSRFHSKLSGAARAAHNFTEQTGASLTRAGAAISGVGMSMTRNLTLPIVAAGGAVTKFALDFDTSLRQIVGLTDVTQEQIGGIREEIMKLGPEVGKGPQELAEAFYFIASAGFEADEAMEVLRTSATAAATGLGETQSVARVLGSVINAYGKENITAARAADILVEAISQGTAEAPEFAAVIGRVAPIAASLGVSFDQVAAALAGMTLAGYDADESATALRQIMVSILKPTVQAEEAMEGLGLSSAGLRKQLREEGLLATLRTLEERFAGNETASAAVFGNIRALGGITALLTLDTEQLNTVFEKVEDSAGRLAEGYEDTEGPQRELDRSMADLQATAIELGTDVMPLVVDILGKVADAAGGLADWWGTLDKGTKELIVSSLAWLAVAGPVLVIVGKLAMGVGALFKLIGFLSGAKGLGALSKAAGTSRLALLGVLGVATGIAVALHEISGGRELGDKVQQFERAMKDAGVESGHFQAALEKSGKNIGDFVEASVELLDAGYSVRDVMRMVSEGISTADWDRSREGIDEAWAAFANFQQALLGTADAADAAALEVAGLPPEIVAILTEGEGPVGDAADGMTDEMIEAAEKARDAAVQAMADMLTGMTNLFDSDEQLQEAWQALIDRMDDPYTEAERKADVFSQNTIDNIRSALATGDPAIAADTLTLVNNMLAQVALMEPGALESGEAVPPAIRDGMDAEMQALIDFIETDVTGEALAAMSLEEAESVGLGGIWRYAKGMRDNEIVATSQARNIAARTKEALGEADFYGGGYSILTSWFDGVWGSWLDNEGILGAVLRAARRRLGGSLPTEGPLKGGAGSGGWSIGSGWIDALTRALDAGMGGFESRVGMVGAALTGIPTKATFGLPAVAPLGISAPRIHSPETMGAWGSVDALSGAAGRPIINVYSQSLVPGTPAELYRIAEAVGPASEMYFERTGRFERRAR